MELFSNLALGFSVSLQPLNLLLCFTGVLLGVVIGILPGLGSAATIALLLPITYFLDTTTAVIMLAGIWYGSMYGGSITSILLRVPGESASVMRSEERRVGKERRHQRPVSHATKPAGMLHGHVS